MGTADNCCVPAFIFGMIALGALCTGVLYEEWYTNGVQKFGLFRNCSAPTSCDWVGFQSPNVDLPFFVVQVLMVASGGFALMAVLLGMIPLASGIFQLIGGLIGGAAVILFGIDSNYPRIDNYGWAYWLTVGAIALLLVNGISLIATTCCTQAYCGVTFGPCHPMEVEEEFESERL